jgi:hypothetical protein
LTVRRVDNGERMRLLAVAMSSGLPPADRLLMRWADAVTADAVTATLTATTADTSDTQQPGTVPAACWLTATPPCARIF